MAVLDNEERADLPGAESDVDDFDDILGEIADPPKAEPTDGFDDILSEIAGPAEAAPADGLDDILSEIAGPAEVAPADGFDDILSEIAGPAEAVPADGFDDILSEIAGPAEVASGDGLDDILSEIAGPAEAAPADGLEDILSEISGPAPVEAAAGPADATDDLSEMLNEIAGAAPVEEPAPPADEKKPGIGAKVGHLLGAVVPDLQGTREISRKAHLGLLGLIGVLGITAIGEAAFILTRPAPAPVSVAHPPPAVTVVPVDYSKVDLDLYRGKVRLLSEGGRDMLRHERIKAAVLDLDGGERLYQDMQALAARSPAADGMTIRNDRVTIVSCNAPVCGDRSFKLVYDLGQDNATVCMTKKYLNGAFLSYVYSMEGYSEEPSCEAIG